VAYSIVLYETVGKILHKTSYKTSYQFIHMFLRTGFEKLIYSKHMASILYYIHIMGMDCGSVIDKMAIGKSFRFTAFSNA
jgi:hypothetical protein